jgi:hypothetical protein
MQIALPGGGAGGQQYGTYQQDNKPGIRMEHDVYRFPTRMADSIKHNDELRFTQSTPLLNGAHTVIGVRAGY